MPAVSQIASSPLPLETPTIEPRHADLLRQSGVTTQFALDSGVRSILGRTGLPESLQESAYAEAPGLLFIWNSPTKGEVAQFRPDEPVVNDQGDPVKYVFPHGVGSILNAVRPEGSTVLLVEGTRQALVAAEYAPDGVAVYGFPGCWNWSHDKVPIADLHVFAGRRVVIILDADSSSNRQVYDAGVALRRALIREGVEWARFEHLAAGGTTGLDDILGERPEEARRDYLYRIVDRVSVPKTKADIKESKVELPADSRPPAKKTKADPTRLAPSHLEQVRPTDLDVSDAYVKRFAGQVIYNRTSQSWAAYRDGVWDGDAGGEALAKAHFQDMIRNEVVAVREDGDGNLVADWEWLYCAPRIGHVLNHVSSNRAMQVTALQLDPDGWMWNAANCVIELRTGVTSAHDPALMMTLQSPVPYDPDAECPEFIDFVEWALPDEEVRTYVQRLLGASMIGEAPGDMQIFPVFTGEGRNGKGALLRIVEAVFGPYATGIKDEMLIETKFASHDAKVAALFRKRLATTSELPAHSKWDVNSIKRLTGGDALTGNFMRQNVFTFPASHTLILSTNHRPAIEADYAFWRRYREIPFTQTLTDEQIDPNLEPRIRANELPGVLNWLIEGLLDYQDHGLKTPDAVIEASQDTRQQADPVYRFVSEEMKRTNKFEDTLVFDQVWSRWSTWCDRQDPREVPGRKTGMVKRFATAAGLTYIYKGDAKTDTPRLRVDGVSNVQCLRRLKWVDDEGVTPEESSVTQDATPENDQGSDVLPGHPASVTPVTPITPESRSTSYKEEENNTPLGEASLTVCVSSSPIALINRETGVSGVTGVTHTSSPAETFVTRSEGRGYQGVVGAFPQVSTAVAFDLETDSAAMSTLFSSGPGYVRLAGYKVDGGEVQVTTDLAEVVEKVTSTGMAIGHNIMGFDMIALARHAGVDIRALAEEDRLVDTKILAMLADPPHAKMSTGEAERYYSLDNVGDRLLGHRKHGDLKALAKEFGGYGQIPVDDERYVEYLRGDVAITDEILAALPGISEYARREHRIAAVAAGLTVSGFQVDVPLTKQRYDEGEARRAELVAWLRAEHGLPTLKKDGKPCTSPQATQAGKAAIEAALIDAGLTGEVLPRTKTGALALDKESADRLLEIYGEDLSGVVDVVEAVRSLNGIRTVYGTVLEHLVGDRVHPVVSMRQASGRWSILDPGLTVFGKRGGKAVERAIFLPDEGHVLISADLSQIDARAVAAWSQDPNYMALFEGDLDLHTQVAIAVFGDKSFREVAKPLSHGSNYGLGLNGFLKRNPKVDPALAAKFYEAMPVQFPGVEEWKADVRYRAENGALLDNGFGRLLYVNPDRAYTQAPALVGQAAARDLMMEGILNLPLDVAAMIRAVVHDEIVLSVPIADVQEIERIVVDSMSFEWAPPGKSRPIQVKAGLGERGLDWAGCYNEPEKNKIYGRAYAA